MRRARILFVAHPLGWGGLEKHLEDLITRAGPTRLEPAILAFGPNRYSEAFRRLGRPDVAVQTAEAPTTFLGYRRALADHAPDVVVFLVGRPGLFPWWAYAAARVSGAKRVVAIEHSQVDPPPARVENRGPMSLLRQAMGWRARVIFRTRFPAHLVHMTVCVSHAVRRRLVDEYGYPEAKTATVVNGIDLNHYRRSGKSREERRLELGIEQNVQLLVCVAGLVRPKRLDRLLESMVAIRGDRPSLRCMIVGAGPLEVELKAQAKTLGLDAVVRFEGPQDDTRPYLEAADIYVISSETEGFGLALAEAMALELPCVATSIDAHSELLADPGTGILVTAGAEDEFRHAIGYLLDHPAEAQVMGRAARKAVEARFDVDRMVRELVTILLDGLTSQADQPSESLTR